MKEFLSTVNELCGRLSEYGEADTPLEEKLKQTFEKLSEEEKEQSLQILGHLLEEDGTVYFYIISALYGILRDKGALYLLEKGILCRQYPLWLRWSAMEQLGMMMFLYNLRPDDIREHKRQREMYLQVLDEIKEALNGEYAYTPYSSRKRKIIIVIGQILGPRHAPTKNLLYIAGMLKKLGYEVKVYVCFHPGGEDNGSGFWYQGMTRLNLWESTMPIIYETERDSITGFNLALNRTDYLQGLAMATEQIWEEKPEFVLELGNETILADLCNTFTTVVRMNFTKSAPITAAPIIASYFTYSEEEKKQFLSSLTKEQAFIEVKYSFDEYKESGSRPFQKADFGIPKDSFVIIIAGNRLDFEIDGKFIKVMKDILDKAPNFSFAILGKCEKLSLVFQQTPYEKQVYFLGRQNQFREAIAMGDVFLNPPHQGGGTGGLLAIMQEIPVITLDNCDVAALTGKEFVCQSVDEMPELVYRYFTDAEFMAAQKKNCRLAAERQTGMEGEASFKGLCDFVKAYTLEKEREI